MELNKIYNENCLVTMSKMPDGYIDLTVTSPPYDNLRDYKGYSFPFDEIAKELYRVTKPGGVVVWIVNNSTVNGSETMTPFKQAIYFTEVCGFNLHDTMIYGKKNIHVYSPRNKRYKNGAEFMFVLSKGSPKTYNPIKDVLSVKSSSTGCTKRDPNGKMRKAKDVDYETHQARSNIWMYNNGYMQTTLDKIAFKHPALFPEQLAADHIISWSNENELVYDCFGGSGTTAKMAHIYRRNWIISEISTEYSILAQKRLNPYLSQTMIF